MRGAWRLAGALALLAVLQLCPLGIAGTHVEAGPLLLDVVDSHANDCPTAPACFAQARGDTLGNTTIDAYQYVDRVSVEVDNSSVEQIGLGSFVPATKLELDAASGYLPNPVLPLWVGAWRASGAASPVPSLVGVEVSENNTTLSYYSVNKSSPRHELYWNDYPIGYADDPDSAGIQYHRIGPFNQLTGGGGSSDSYVDRYQREACGATPSRLCRETYASTTAKAEDATPSVSFGLRYSKVGFEFHEVAAQPRRSMALVAAQEISSPPWPPLWPAWEPAPEAQTPPESVPILPEALPPVSDEAGPSLVPPPAAMDAGRTPPPSAEPTVAPQAGRGLVGIAVGAALCVALTGLYSRFSTRAEVLDSEPRARLLALVQEGPRSLAQLSEKTGLARSSVLHHARILERMGLVHVARGNGALRVSASGSKVTQRDLQRSDVAGRIMELLSTAGRCARSSLHHALRDVPIRTRNYHLRNLIVRGLVAEEPDGTFTLRPRS